MIPVRPDVEQAATRARQLLLSCQFGHARTLLETHLADPLLTEAEKLFLTPKLIRLLVELDDREAATPYVRRLERLVTTYPVSAEAYLMLGAFYYDSDRDTAKYFLKKAYALGRALGQREPKLKALLVYASIVLTEGKTRLASFLAKTILSQAGQSVEVRPQTQIMMALIEGMNGGDYSFYLQGALRELVESQNWNDYLGGLLTHAIILKSSSQRDGALALLQHLKQFDSMISPRMRRSLKALEDSLSHETADLIVDMPEGRIYGKSVKDLYLAKYPVLMKILAELARSPGQVVRKDQLATSVWSEPYTPEDDNKIYFHINRLRKKIETNPRNPRMILSKTQGYALAPNLKVQLLVEGVPSAAMTKTGETSYATISQ